MNRSILSAAAATALVLAGGASARAELIYGFENSEIDSGFGNNNPDGFQPNAGSKVAFETTTGVTQGVQALQLTTKDTNTTGETPGYFYTFDVPAALMSANTLSLDLTLSDAVNYYNLYPRFEIAAPGGSDYPLQSENGVYVPTNAGALAVGATGSETIDLKAFLDPSAGTIASGGDGNLPGVLYTVGQIAAANSALDGVPYSAYLFELQTDNGASTDGGTTVVANFDNFTVPSAAVPEPASLAGLALGGLALVGRRRRQG